MSWPYLTRFTHYHFFYSFLNPEKGEALAEVKKTHVEQLPIPAATPDEQNAIATRVESILAAKAGAEAGDVAVLWRGSKAKLMIWFSRFMGDKQFNGRSQLNVNRP